MTWNTGTSTNYLDLLTKLRQIATSDHVATAAVTSGGTGYTAGDILSIAGGTATHTATIEVLTVSSGVISTVRIKTGGAYTVDPTLANSVTGGTGSGATITVTMASTGWTVRRETEQVTAAVIDGGGTGYTAGDTLTVVGGLGVGSSDAVTAATITVDTVSSGVITAVTLADGGSYEEPISPTTAVGVTGGTGNGATFDLTFAVVTDADKVLVMDGAAGGGGDEVTVAIKTFNTTAGFNTAYNWMLLGMADFNASLLLQEQSSISPGIATSGSSPIVVTEDTTEGAFIPLKTADGFTMTYWFSVTDRRIIGVVKLESALVTHYASFYMGFLNQFGTAAERPYPIYIAGSASRHDTYFGDVAPLLITGLTECYSNQSGRAGPGYYREHSSSTWISVQNGFQAESTGSRSGGSDEGAVYPVGEIALRGTSATVDKIVTTGNGMNWDDMIQHGTDVDPTYELRETPGSPDDLRALIPCAVIYGEETADKFEVQGEMDSVFWTSIAGGSPAVGSEDTFNVGGEVYSIFQCGNRANVYSFMVIKED